MHTAQKQSDKLQRVNKLASKVIYADLNAVSVLRSKLKFTTQELHNKQQLEFESQTTIDELRDELKNVQRDAKESNPISILENFLRKKDRCGPFMYGKCFLNSWSIILHHLAFNQI